MITQGKRIFETDHRALDALTEPGSYMHFYNDITGKWCWFGVCPTERSDDPKSPFFQPVVCALGAHDVVEHEDGTITVSPSIQVTRRIDEPELWHGYLERGIWRTL